MIKNKVDHFLTQSQKVLKGKSPQLKLVLSNILSGGHTLIEDTPGVGKTTLVKLLAKSCHLELSRIQFTNDLLPSDILGSQIFNKDNQEFSFHKGPIFGELILADELNRATPKTQSALLQAMEEKRVTVNGNSFNLPEVFSVVATQNPHSQIGTYPLPESQLDRFSLKLKMGHPDKVATIEMLKGIHADKALKTFPEFLTQEDIKEFKEKVQSIHIEDVLFDHIYTILEQSRVQEQYIDLSNRSAIDLTRIMKAWAILDGRDFCTPDDLFYLFPYVCGHRLVSPESSDLDLEHQLAQQLLKTTAL